MPNDYVRQVGNLDDHSMHRVSVAVRESVMNAIKDGNAEDETKRVLVEFEVHSTTQFTQLMLHVVDQGAGFAPETAAAPCHLRTSSGRSVTVSYSCG